MPRKKRKGKNEEQDEESYVVGEKCLAFWGKRLYDAQIVSTPSATKKKYEIKWLDSRRKWPTIYLDLPHINKDTDDNRKYQQELEHEYQVQLKQGLIQTETRKIVKPRDIYISLKGTRSEPSSALMEIQSALIAPTERAHLAHSARVFQKMKQIFIPKLCTKCQSPLELELGVSELACTKCSVYSAAIDMFACAHCPYRLCNSCFGHDIQPLNPNEVIAAEDVINLSLKKGQIPNKGQFEAVLQSNLSCLLFQLPPTLFQGDFKTLGFHTLLSHTKFREVLLSLWLSTSPASRGTAIIPQQTLGKEIMTKTHSERSSSSLSLSNAPTFISEVRNEFGTIPKRKNYYSRKNRGSAFTVISRSISLDDALSEPLAQLGDLSQPVEPAKDIALVMEQASKKSKQDCETTFRQDSIIVTKRELSHQTGNDADPILEKDSDQIVDLNSRLGEDSRNVARNSVYSQSALASSVFVLIDGAENMAGRTFRTETGLVAEALPCPDFQNANSHELAPANHNTPPSAHHNTPPSLPTTTTTTNSNHIKITNHNDKCNNANTTTTVIVPVSISQMTISPPSLLHDDCLCLVEPLSEPFDHPALSSQAAPSSRTQPFSPLTLRCTPILSGELNCADTVTSAREDPMSSPATALGGQVGRATEDIEPACSVTALALLSAHHIQPPVNLPDERRLAVGCSPPTRSPVPKAAVGVGCSRADNGAGGCVRRINARKSDPRQEGILPRSMREMSTRGISIRGNSTREMPPAASSSRRKRHCSSPTVTSVEDKVVTEIKASSRVHQPRTKLTDVNSNSTRSPQPHGTHVGAVGGRRAITVPALQAWVLEARLRAFAGLGPGHRLTAEQAYLILKQLSMRAGDGSGPRTDDACNSIKASRSGRVLRAANHSDSSSTSSTAALSGALDARGWLSEGEFDTLHVALGFPVRASLRSAFFRRCGSAHHLRADSARVDLDNPNHPNHQRGSLRVKLQGMLGEFASETWQGPFCFRGERSFGIACALNGERRKAMLRCNRPFPAQCSEWYHPACVLAVEERGECYRLSPVDPCPHASRGAHDNPKSSGDQRPAAGNRSGSADIHNKVKRLLSDSGLGQWTCPGCLFADRAVRNGDGMRGHAPRPSSPGSGAAGDCNTNIFYTTSLSPNNLNTVIGESVLEMLHSSTALHQLNNANKGKPALASFLSSERVSSPSADSGSSNSGDQNFCVLNRSSSEVCGTNEPAPANTQTFPLCEGPPFLCLFCNRDLAKRSALISHQKTHERELRDGASLVPDPTPSLTSCADHDYQLDHVDWIDTHPWVIDPGPLVDIRKDFEVWMRLHSDPLICTLPKRVLNIPMPSLMLATEASWLAMLSAYCPMERNSSKLAAIAQEIFNYIQAFISY